MAQQGKYPVVNLSLKSSKQPDYQMAYACLTGENASLKGFCGKMTDFIRSLFESALKTNPYLEFAVIPGCLRISRESIFTALNNLSVYSILNNQYADSFGFTQDEVKLLLASYGRESKFAEVKRWYDGYRFGNQEIYNPWSILNYAAAILENPEAWIYVNTLDKKS